MTLKDVLMKYQNHPEFLGQILTDPNQRGAVDDSPLHIAARKGELQDVEVLVAHGGNINSIGDLGNSPLHQAALSGHEAMVRLLLNLGADPSIKNEFSQTALDVAFLGKHNEVAKILRGY